MTLSAGTPFTIDANGDQSTGVAKIGSTSSLTLYYDAVAAAMEARVVESDETVNAAETVTANGKTGYALQTICVLSSVKAIVAYIDAVATTFDVAVITIAGTNLTFEGGSIINPTDAFDTSTEARMVALSSSSFVLILNNAGSTYGYYFTVSGTTITEESYVAFDGNVLSTSVTSLSSLKVITAYEDNDDSNILKMCVLSISGVTISAGTPVNIEANDVGSGSYGDTALAPIDSSHVLLGYANTTDSATRAVVVTVSGAVPGAATPATVVASVGQYLDLAAFSSTIFALFYDDQMAEIGVSGTATTAGTPAAFTTDTPSSNYAVAFDSSTAIVVSIDGVNGFRGVIITAAAAGNGLDIAPMRKPADIDADGTYVYIAALNSSAFPILVQILADLSADGTIVFNPGAGTDIGVECGNFDASTVWVGGAFDGTNVLERTSDAGASFTVKDDGSFGDVVTFALGPDSDDKVLIIDANQDIHETIDDGATWTTHQTAVGAASKAVARLDKNTQEIVVGNVAGATDNIQYSPNTGADLEDYSTGFPQEDVTGVIVG